MNRIPWSSLELLIYVNLVCVETEIFYFELSKRIILRLKQTFLIKNV